MLLIAFILSVILTVLLAGIGRFRGTYASLEFLLSLAVTILIAVVLFL